MQKDIPHRTGSERPVLHSGRTRKWEAGKQDLAVQLSQLNAMRYMYIMIEVQ